jgi:carboxymethylenebutenolidase
MCFDDDSHPPIPLTENSGAHGKDMRLHASDGTESAAYLAEPAENPSANVVILPDVRGLHNFYRELALRFADVGTRALAIDYFGRTAPSDDRAEPFEARAHVQQMTQETFGRDLTAAVEMIEHCEGKGIPTFTIGFCLGGSLSLWAGTRGLGLAGVVAFYAGLSRNFGAVVPASEYARQITTPVLGLFGGADAGIPQADRDALDGYLDEAGVPHEIVVYPDAPHGFFDRKAAEFAMASADAWTRVQGFIAGAQPVRV